MKMPMKAIYKPVNGELEDDCDDNVVVFEIDDGRAVSPNQGSEDGYENHIQTVIPLEIDGITRPMEISTSSFDEDYTENLFGWKDPWFPAVLISLIMMVPVLIGYTVLFRDILGVWFAADLFALHLLLSIIKMRHLVTAPLATLESPCSRIFTSIIASVDVLLLGIVYPRMTTSISDAFFKDVDGTTVIEWSGYAFRFQLYKVICLTAALLRTLLCVNAIGLRFASASMESSLSTAPTWYDRYCTCPRFVVAPFLYADIRLQSVTRYCSVKSDKKKRMRRALRWFLDLALIAAITLAIVCVDSSFRHFGIFTPPQVHDDDCDPLDETECFLPFPSFHLLKKDNSSVTGWRVNLQGRLLPYLKRGIRIHTDGVNKMDGFSTMAPILFYLDGLKQAHEAGIGQLKGSNYIADSTTHESATLLLDVDTKVLIPHSSEIDYLDGHHPLVLLSPAFPLYHNRHYAVAVVNATDAHYHRLAPTQGMQILLSNGKNNFTSPSSILDTDRKTRFINVVIPALEQAASWFSYASDPQSLQLLFDFHTISEQSQLGIARTSRDIAIKQISSVEWDWKKHVRTISRIDYDCSDPEAILARTVHAELDVPWFFDGQKSGSRGAFLDENSLMAGKTAHLGTSKFLVHIPCSLQASALGKTGNKSKPLRAILEYGHGLFGDRNEASEQFLLQMAHDEGYIITAMDWRGMSRFDLLVVVKVLICAPMLFQSVRDNLIQGYVNKLALQHFSRHSMLAMDWFLFDSKEKRSNSTSAPGTVPTLNNASPAFVFYGISQGGILGAGYTALSGPTKLLDRSILGSPGTPFAMIMTRCLDFSVYDKLLLFDFYDNRHIRFFLSIVQMFWDTVEASGTLAPPVNEPYPRVLIQSGLGDTIVPTISSEALGRAFNASSLPGGPRVVFGINTEPAANGTSLGPYATLTEVEYEKEYLALPVDNILPEIKSNDIHVCLRRDKAMIKQTSEFINTGRTIDPCVDDGCHRLKIDC